MEGRAPNAVLLYRDKGFVLEARTRWRPSRGVRTAIWGDLDDDGLVDVVLGRAAGGIGIWRQPTADVDRGDGRGRIAMPAGEVIDGAMFDADHDGDLDIWLVNAKGPNELLNNDGDFRLRAIGVSAGVAGDGRPSLGLAVADLDGDRDADVIVIKAAPPHDVFLNDRVWTYRRDARAAALVAAAIAR